KEHYMANRSAVGLPIARGAGGGLFDDVAGNIHVFDIGIAWMVDPLTRNEGVNPDVFPFPVRHVVEKRIRKLLVNRTRQGELIDVCTNAGMVGLPCEHR